jgi:hypothetical protein
MDHMGGPSKGTFMCPIPVIIPCQHGCPISHHPMSAWDIPLMITCHRVSGVLCLKRIPTLLPYCPIALPPYHPTALPPYRPTALPPYRPTALPPYCPTTIPPYHNTALPPQLYRHTTLLPHCPTTLLSHCLKMVAMNVCILNICSVGCCTV